MSGDEPGVPALARQAAEAAQDGRTDEARALLGRALARDDGYEPAWLWLASLAETAGERKYCLERAAEASEDSVARSHLHGLRHIEAVPPEEVADSADPPDPPAPALKGPSRGGGRRRWLAAGAALALAALVFTLVRVGEDKPSPVYVAVATSLSGHGSALGKEVLRSVRFQAERVNADGGVAGHPVELLVHDDKDDPDTARRTAGKIVRDGRAALVLGHTVSDTAMAAGPVYAKAGIPAITPTATADAVAEVGPRYFRTAFSNSYQGAFIATYLRAVDRAREAVVIRSDTDYGRTLGDGFAKAFAKKGKVRQLDVGRVDRGDSGRRIAEAVKKVERGGTAAGPVVLAVHEDMARQLIRGLREAGVRNPLVGGDALSNDSFLASLTAHRAKPERERLTRNLRLASPLMNDSLSGGPLRWAEDYRARYGHLPSWQAMSAQTSLSMAIDALRRSGVSTSAPDRSDHRAVGAALAAMDTPHKGVNTLQGPVHFASDRSLPQPVAMGVVEDDKVVSAPIQLVARSAAEDTGTDQETDEGRAVRFQGQTLVRQQIVAAGFNINELAALDTHTETFQADFFLWLKYRGSDRATAIEFANAEDPSLALGEPVRSSEYRGLKYRLYHVQGVFKAPLDFHDFPFDRQSLRVTLQNQHSPSSRVVYAGDRELLEEADARQLRSGSDTHTSIDRLSGWKATDLALYKETVGSTAALGDPALGDRSSGIHYGQYIAEVTIERDVGSFLVKNLLPLLLLVLATYISLFFPRDSSYTGTRVSFGVTGILSTAVLLTAVTSSLPEVEYAVAIEWGYYAFIFLAATCVLIALFAGRVAASNDLVAWRRLAIGSRLYYALFCVAVALAYVWRYG